LGLDETEHATAIEQAGPGSDVRTVAFDLMTGDDYFVLTDALGDFSSRERFAAEDGENQEFRLRWAAAAEAILDRIEAALDQNGAPRP